MNRIGLHVRVTTSFADIAHKAIRLKLPFFQCFLTNESQRYLRYTQKLVKEFLLLRRAHFGPLYVHASYWINLCSSGYTGQKTLEKELRLAKRLEFTHLVLHPGCARAIDGRLRGIELLARALNVVLKKEHDITIVLENTAHGKGNIGADLRDFYILLNKLNQPEKVRFCIDTAHAYSYGYDLVSDRHQDAFIHLIEKTIGIERVALIHLNDTHEQLGSKIDQHVVTGNGNIGLSALRRFINQPSLSEIPIIMELPEISEEKEIDILTTVMAWCAQDYKKNKESELWRLQ